MSNAIPLPGDPSGDPGTQIDPPGSLVVPSSQLEEYEISLPVHHGTFDMTESCDDPDSDSIQLFTPSCGASFSLHSPFEEILLGIAQRHNSPAVPLPDASSIDPSDNGGHAAHNWSTDSILQAVTCMSRAATLGLRVARSPKDLTNVQTARGAVALLQRALGPYPGYLAYCDHCGCVADSAPVTPDEFERFIASTSGIRKSVKEKVVAAIETRIRHETLAWAHAEESSARKAARVEIDNNIQDFRAEYTAAAQRRVELEVEQSYAAFKADKLARRKEGIKSDPDFVRESLEIRPRLLEEAANAIQSSPDFIRERENLYHRLMDEASRSIQAEISTIAAQRQEFLVKQAREWADRHTRNPSPTKTLSFSNMHLELTLTPLGTRVASPPR
ncbi:hypothetical protein BC834DRAFT_843202 [Gloeopeniophorella convolvens]|nr:hypothetical protein BC834DRAFT_847541 [Gloeopeniophorella convolvens]KAI0266144.1 hypothetical protein BC834DRAFT_843202 [Gloeopeniophorella convolvens]